MSKPFKLSCTLLGHSLDVRSVCTTSEDTIISGSRDTTAKFWRPNGFNTGYSDVMTYRDQQKFVASVLYLEPSNKFPDGLVITGGNDSVILAYRPGEPFATIKLREHNDTVCRLTKGIEPNSFYSGSWDKSAKYWALDKSNASLTTFLGHAAAVWGVTPLQNGNIATASADRTVGISSMDGTRLQTIQAHNDCVRDIIDFPELNYFATVSNDASIKIWSYNGEPMQTFYGHSNFIYSIARNKAGGENCFVTSDEDRTVRYWKDGVNTEVIHLPAQSVWSVACLNNGDIVTGSSDGAIRIFTQDINKYANEEAMRAYEESVEALTKQAMQEIGGYKVADLPGKEALYDPGKKPGQMKMIRENGGVVAYSWVEDGENSHWEKVGDVLGGTDKTAEGKTTFEGKDYDYVFSVDVEDGKPPLKLPFNKGGDPYVAAHEFLSKNFLPATYLDQVVDFILKNSGQQNVGQPNPAFVDPFTGGSRYTPGSASASTSFSGQNLDPFTGSSSYSTSIGSSGTSNNVTSGSNADPFTGGSSYTSKVQPKEPKFFPQNVYRTFDMGDPKLIMGKLKEFNKKAGDSNGLVAESLIEEAVNCTNPCGDAKCYDCLYELLNWPDEFIFPVIDAMRLAVKHESNNRIIATRDNGLVLEKLKRYLASTCEIPNNTLVTLRFFSNLLAFPLGEELIFANRVDLLENIASLQSSNKNIQIGLATFLLNMAILSLKRNDEIGIVILASVIPEIIAALDDPEAQFRAYVAIGTLLSSIENNKVIKEKVREHADFMKVLQKATVEYGSDIELKRKKCAVQLQNELYN